MSFNYAIAGVKDGGEGELLSFAIILKDMPEYEGFVFMYDDLKFVEEGEGIAIQVGFSYIQPGGAKQQKVDMKPEMIELMSELIQQVSNDILTAQAKEEMSREQNTDT